MGFDLDRLSFSGSLVGFDDLARPHSHRRRWRSMEARGRKIDEMRESESCVVRLRERGR